MQRQRFLLAAAAGCVAATSLLVSAQEPPHAGNEPPAPAWTEDFEDGRAEGWELEPGWTIATVDGRRCLQGNGHSWARRAGARWSDFEMMLVVRLTRGGLHVNLRTDAMRRYFLGVRAGELYLSKQTGPDRFEELATARWAAPPGGFAVFEIVAHGPHLAVLVEGEPRLEIIDPDPLLAGGLAFETLPESTACIDQVLVVGPVAGAPEEPRRAERHEMEAPRRGAETPASAVPAPAEPRLAQPPPSAELTVVAPQRLLLAGPVEAPTHVVPAMPARVPLTALQKALRWHRTGGPLGGLGYDVRILPDPGRVMYVSDAWAGVFKSTDSGDSWFPANGKPGAGEITVKRGLTAEAFPVFSLTVDPHDPRTIWVGTKDNLGIFKSTDAGQSWKKLDKGVKEQKGITFRGFTVDPRPGHSRTVWAAAEISSKTWTQTKLGKKQVLAGKNFDKTMGVVYRTTNGGKSWQEVRRADNLARYIWIDPRDPKTIYVSTGIFDREAANTDASKNQPGGVGVLKTTDGGKSWRALDHRNGLGNLYVGSLFMHPRNPDVLLAGTGCNAWLEGAGVYLSENGGEEWELTQPGRHAEAFTAVEFAVSHPQIAYAGSNLAIYRSEDSGRTWTQMTDGLAWGPEGVRAGWPIDLQVDRRNPDRVFANNYGGGNFLSTDGGRTWRVASRGYTGAQARDIAVDSRHSDRVYAAARSGLFSSSDGGDHWQGLNHPPANGLDWPAIAVDPEGQGRLLAATQWQRQHIFVRAGSEARWRLSHDLPLAPQVGVRVIVFAPSQRNRVYAGTGGLAPFNQYQDNLPGNGILVSDDGGANWRQANDAGSRDAHVKGLAVHPTRPDTVFAATLNDHGLLRTTDGGRSWQVTLRPAVLSVAFHPTQPDTVYAGLDRGGLHRSTDGGDRWHPWMTNMNQNASVSEILVDPTRPAILYAADRMSGVYRSENGGAHWTPINLGLTNREVNAMALSRDGRRLYAAVEGAGVFRLDLP